MIMNKVLTALDIDSGRLLSDSSSTCSYTLTAAAWNNVGSILGLSEMGDNIGQL